MRRRIFLLSTLSLLPQLSSAASFSITGNGRFGTHLIENPDLDGGTRTGATNTTAYADARFLVRPDVVIDDRFTIRTEFVLSPTAVGVNDQSSQFGTALGNGTSFTVSRAYLDWASDWGILSVGRMPKHWGLGLLFDSGNSVFDDYESLRERIAFRALLGNLAVALAYEKGYEGLLSNSQDDIDAYELSIEYSNPETLFDVGLLYNRSVVMTGAPAALDPSGSAHHLSIYSRKRWNDLQLGGEFLHINSDSGRVGFLTQIDYMPGAWEWGLDVGLASGSSVTPLSFNPNYRPFMLLFRESMGPAAIDVARGGAGGTMAVGKAIGKGTGNGAFLSKLSGSYGFDNKTLRFGADVGFATFASQGTSAGKLLGVETDVHLTQKWYDNFDMIYSLGLLVPGSGFGPGQQGAWGMQIRGALTF